MVSLDSERRDSRGVRLPKPVRAKYAIRDAVVLEERDEGLFHHRAPVPDDRAGTVTG